MRDVGWVRVFLGTVTTLVLAVLLTLLAFATVDRLLYAIFIGEGAWVSVTEERLHAASSGLFHLASVLLAAFSGGLVAGGSNRSYPGFRGAGSAAVAALGAFALFAGPLIPWLWEPASNPGEAYVRSDTLNNLLVVGAVSCVVFCPFVLAGYIGGRFGQPILRWIADR